MFTCCLPWLNWQKPKEDQWSHVTDEKKHEPDDDVSTLELLKYKAMLYGTMVMPAMSVVLFRVCWGSHAVLFGAWQGKLRGDIEYTKFLIKLKKRQFGIDVYAVIEEDGKVISNPHTPTLVAVLHACLRTT